MKLSNTKQYYRDLAHYYIGKDRFYLAGLFYEYYQNSSKQHSFSTTDNFDWFRFKGITRPERNEDDQYI